MDQVYTGVSDASSEPNFRERATIEADGFVRKGSDSEVQRAYQEGLLLGLEQTKSGRKRTLPLKGPLSRVDRT